jgi:hypothetical protein
MPALKLRDAVQPAPEKILNPTSLSFYGGVRAEVPVLVVLAAGKGTRFGASPKCIQPVCNTPLARYSIDGFRNFIPAPVICVVGFRYGEVSAALSSDNIFVRSDNPTGGTAFAAYEACSVPELDTHNPLLIITMGDRIVPSSIFRRLHETHCGGGREADLTFLTAIYEPPRNRGKGRVVRDREGRVLRIVEEKDIAVEPEGPARDALFNLTEGNCPLYVVRARTLMRHVADLDNDNAQSQYYITDIIERISREGGEIRTLTTRVSEPEYDLLCSDVTRPTDLALLEGHLEASRSRLFPGEFELDTAVRTISSGRPAAQVAAIARQLRAFVETQGREKLGFKPERPVGVGISGGRLRIAFMHPDMMRFFGPAWQMPIGAGCEDGGEQIVVLTQEAEDSRIHLHPMNPKFRESIDHIASDDAVMYPGEDVSDLYRYEEFGTHMSESLLLSLGYFSDEEVEARRRKGLPLPPVSLRVGNSMRRPFALVANAIASMRTLRTGNLGAAVQRRLGRQNFRGLHMAVIGDIPQGGFSSSSAVTLATKNAVNGLLDLRIPPDLLVHLACQAEYGTGVRAGSLDQATEQKGRAGEGTLISSNPRDNFRILGTYPVPADRFQILFPYTVDRDRAAWQWSWGAYAEAPGDGPLTTAETRKMTGKAAEIAAVLLRLPLQTDFFKEIEDELLAAGSLSVQTRASIAARLRSLPLRIDQSELRERVFENRDWYAAQLAEADGLDLGAARQKADSALAALFSGWRNPVLRRTDASGQVVVESGVPVRAMLAYLYGEVAKNFHLIHHPDEWIECVTLSQRGDRCLEIDPARLPSRHQMEDGPEWDAGPAGPQRLNRWLEGCGATPFDFNAGLDDASLEGAPDFHRLQGSNFFRGLALIDLAEAMLKRAFGADAVAVRVNAAGQGDYFQVHVDKLLADPLEVKTFLRHAFYRRFDLAPEPEFVEVHPGGGATGLRLSRFDSVAQLVPRLQSLARQMTARDESRRAEPLQAATV